MQKAMCSSRGIPNSSAPRRISSRLTERAKALSFMRFNTDFGSRFSILSGRTSEPCSLVRPDKIENLEPKSVLKRMKDKAFARSVSREDIRRGAEELGIPLEEHIAFCIQAMRSIASELGLAASQPAITPL